MKKSLCVLLTLLLVLCLFGCGGSGNAQKGLQVGFDRQITTPTQNGVPIAGGDADARPSDSVLDDTTLSCIALAMDGETYLIYTCDQMIFYSNSIDPIKLAITADTGIPKENILLNCTHTHSSANISSRTWDGVGAYRERFTSRSVKAAELAIADLSPATISYGSTQAENMAFVRHYLMNDGTTCGNGHGSTASGYKSHMYDADVELQIIQFNRAAEDKKDIMIASFPAHATTVNGTNKYSISADYPGAFRAAVEAAADVHCAFFQGASGDQIPKSNIQGLAATENDHRKQGQKLAEYALSVELTPMEDSKLVMKKWGYTGASMKEGMEDAQLMAHAAEVSGLASAKGASDASVQALARQYGFSSVYDATGLTSRTSAPDMRSMELVAMQLGSEVSIVFAPYEMFGMHGAYIKENSPFAMDFIVTCSEDYQGYFPHIEGCEHGFYEYDVTKYERGTGEKLAELYVTTLTEMKNAN